jgi:hypothetical protein
MKNLFHWDKLLLDLWAGSTLSFINDWKLLIGNILIILIRVIAEWILLRIQREKNKQEKEKSS